MLFKEEHPSKAPRPIDSNPSGSWHEFNAVHSPNAEDPISLTFLGIIIVFRLLQLSNVLLVDYQYYTL